MNLKKIHPLVYLLGVIILALVAYLALILYERDYATLPYLGPQVETEEGVIYHQVPEFLLTDQSGEAFGSNSVDNKIYVANFFFTSCPTICPEMTKNLKSLQDEIVNYSDVEILSFTVDPKRDDPPRLLQYAQQHEAYLRQWHFLTGEKKDLYRLARNGFYLSATEGDGGPHDFIHSENFVLIDQDGRIRGYYDGTKPSTVPTLKADIDKLRKSRS